MSQTRTIGILGGGIGGLASAFYLARRSTPNVRIVLLERSSRFGGWISTSRLGPTYSNHSFEAGPRTLRLQGGLGSTTSFAPVNSLKLIEDLDLMRDQFCPIEKTAAVNRNRLIFSNDQLINLDNISFFFGGKPLKYPLFVYLIYEYFSKAGRHAVQDETIKSFIYRRFGDVLGENLVEFILDPVMKGIYAGDVRKLSAKTVLKKLFELEQRHGSIVAGLFQNRGKKDEKNPFFDDLNVEKFSPIFDRNSIFYFRDGMEILVERLVEVLRTFSNVELKTNQKIESIRFDDRRVSLNNDEFQFDHLVSAVPSFELAKLFDSNEFSTLQSLLNRIGFVNMIVVNLLYESEKIYPQDAFGYLIPSREHSRLLGVLFDTCVRQRVDGQKRGSQLTVMMGGRWYDEWRFDQCSDEQILKFVQNDLKKHIGLDEKPWRFAISRLRHAIPNYNVGHEDLLDDINAIIRQKHLPLSLVGNSYRGVGVNDVIYDARVEMEYLNIDSMKNQRE